MFLEPNEHVIIMDERGFSPLSVEDFDMVRSSGAKTVLSGSTIGKDSFEPIQIDGLKFLHPFYYSTETMVEIFNRADQVEKFAEQCIKKANPVNNQIIYGIPGGGEFLWDALITKNFPLSDSQIIEFVIRIQRVLVQQYGEIWMLMHNWLGHHENWNNTHLPLLYQALVDEFPGVPFYSVQFAHFKVGKTFTDPRNRTGIKKYYKQFGIKTFVGSQYCEGMSENFDLAIDDGAYGYITAPRHRENPNEKDRIEQWMVDAIRESIERWDKWHGEHTMES